MADEGTETAACRLERIERLEHEATLGLLRAWGAREDHPEDLNVAWTFADKVLVRNELTDMRGVVVEDAFLNFADKQFRQLL